MGRLYIGRKHQKSPAFAGAICFDLIFFAVGRVFSERKRGAALPRFLRQSRVRRRRGNAAAARHRQGDR